MGEAQVNEKVRRILMDWGLNVRLTPGGYQIPYESTAVNISVVEQEDRTLIQFWAPVLSGLKGTPELFEWVATAGQAYFFGASRLVQPSDDGTYLLVFEHTLLGDFLDTEELKQVVGALANTADGLDDELKPRFGGSRFVD